MALMQLTEVGHPTWSLIRRSHLHDALLYELQSTLMDQLYASGSDGNVKQRLLRLQSRIIPTRVRGKQIPITLDN
jgi:hypothetical protein